MLQSSPFATDHNGQCAGLGALRSPTDRGIEELHLALRASLGQFARHRGCDGAHVDYHRAGTGTLQQSFVQHQSAYIRRIRDHRHDHVALCS